MKSHLLNRRAGTVGAWIGCLVALLVTPGLPSASAEDATEKTVPGLLYELYELPRRPKTVRSLLPGVPPASVGVLDALRFTKEEGFEGPKESIQIEIRGELMVPADGEYTFDLESDDGVEIYLDGDFLAKDAWVNGSKPPSRATRTLKQGWVPVRASYYQGDGGAGLMVKWKTTDEDEFAPIPAEAFRVSSAQIEAAKHAFENPEDIGDDPATAYRAIFRSEGFFELPEAEGDLLVDLLEGPTTYSASHRKDLGNLLEAANYDELPAWHQVKILAGHLRGWPDGRTDRGPVLRRDKYTVSDAEAVTYDGWRGAVREGFVQTITFEDGHEVTLYTPLKDASERDDVPKAVAGLPGVLRVMLKKVTVEPYGTAREYNGGGSNIWVRLDGPASLASLDSTLSHEIGHLLMNKTDNYLAWEKALGEDILSVSHYGRLNPSEDFAEFVRLYLGTYGDPAQIQSLHKIFPARMAEMDRALDKVGFDWDDFQPTSDEHLE